MAERVSSLALRLVRLQHHVVEAEQSLGHARLAREHVQAGGPEAAVHQSIDQGGLVHHRSARHVDQPALGPERLDHLGSDQAGGVGPPLQVRIRQSIARASSTRSP